MGFVDRSQFSNDFHTLLYQLAEAYRLIVPVRLQLHTVAVAPLFATLHQELRTDGGWPDERGWLHVRNMVRDVRKGRALPPIVVGGTGLPKDPGPPALWDGRHRVAMLHLLRRNTTEAIDMRDWPRIGTAGVQVDPRYPNQELDAHAAPRRGRYT